MNVGESVFVYSAKTHQNTDSSATGRIPTSDRPVGDLAVSKMNVPVMHQQRAVHQEIEDAMQVVVVT